MVKGLQMKTPHSFKLIIVGLCLAFSQGLAMAQTTKVVVIPLGADGAKPLKNVITVASQNGDFDDPVAAVSSITNASESNPYLVVVAPGVYILNSQLQMKSWVHLSGSGQSVTTLKGNFLSDEFDEATIELENNSTVSDMYIVGSPIGNRSIAVYNYQKNNTARLERVKLLATGGTLENRGLHSELSSPTLQNIHVTATGNAINYAIRNYRSSPTMAHITAIAEAGSSKNYAFYNSGSESTSEIFDLVAQASGTNSYAIHNTNDAAPKIRRSSLKGETGAILLAGGGTVIVTQSSIEGSVSGTGTTICAATDNGDGVLLGAACD